MILNMHSPHTGFEEVRTCQNCGLKAKAKCRWKWLWRAGPSSLSGDYGGTKLAGWGCQTVTGAERRRAGDGAPGQGLFLPSEMSVLTHHCFLAPVVELISSRRPHHWRAADRPAVSSVIKETLPNEPCPGTRNMGLWPHCLGHGAGSEEDNSGLRPTLRVVLKPTVGISKVLVMIWVLTPLRGQIRLKAMAPLSSFLHWNPQTHVCALLCVDAVFPLLEC